MRRREFIAGLGGAVAAWPVRASAQQSAAKVFRFGIAELSPAELNPNLAAFRAALRELGYVEGRDVILEYRSVDGDARRFPA
jgi:putative ABC transport system substrate-binding protein